MMTRTNDCDWSLIVSDLGNETDECKISQGQNAIKKYENQQCIMLFDYCKSVWNIYEHFVRGNKEPA